MGFAKNLGFILYVVGGLMHFGPEVHHAQEWSGWDPEVSEWVHILLTSLTLIITQEQTEKRVSSWG